MGANSGRVTGTPLSKTAGIGKLAANQVLQNATSTALNKALGQEGSWGDALTSTLANTFAAAGFNWVGDVGVKHDLSEGGLAKTSLHAIMGGLAAEAAGGDFKTGALVAGANEALIETLAKQYKNMSYEQRAGLLTMNSQVLGVLVASVSGAEDKDLQTGAWVAGNATQYNRQLHPTERDLAEWLAAESDGRYTKEQIEEQLRLSGIAGTEITAGTDILVDGPADIYDEGAQWFELPDGRYIQVFSTADMNPEIINYVNEKTHIYSWLSSNSNSGETQYTPPFEYNICVACAAGFSYGIDTASMITIAESEANARAMTLGISSMVALPTGLIEG